jgi:hypothetical protein
MLAMKLELAAVSLMNAIVKRTGRVVRWISHRRPRHERIHKPKGCGICVVDATLSHLGGCDGAQTSSTQRMPWAAPQQSLFVMHLS